MSARYAAALVTFVPPNLQHSMQSACWKKKASASLQGPLPCMFPAKSRCISSTRNARRSTPSNLGTILLSLLKLMIHWCRRTSGWTGSANQATPPPPRRNLDRRLPAEKRRQVTTLQAKKRRGSAAHAVVALEIEKSRANKRSMQQQTRTQTRKALLKTLQKTLQKTLMHQMIKQPQTVKKRPKNAVVGDDAAVDGVDVNLRKRQTQRRLMLRTPQKQRALTIRAIPIQQHP